MVIRKPDGSANGLISYQISELQKDVTEIKTIMDNKFVTREEYEQSRKDVSNLYKLVYGLLSIIASPIILFLVNAILGSVLKK